MCERVWSGRPRPLPLILLLVLLLILLLILFLVLLLVLDSLLNPDSNLIATLCGTQIHKSPNSCQYPKTTRSPLSP